MLRCNRSVLTVAILALMGNPLFGQVRIQIQPGKQIQNFRIALPGGGQKMNLITRNAAIQKDLKITEEQLKKLKEIQQSTTKARQQAIKLKGKERITKLQELQKKSEKDVDAVLTKEQLVRLEQIQFQQRTRNNLRGVFYPPFDQKIGITPEQKQQMQTRFREQTQAIRNLPKTLEPADRRKAYEEIRKATDKAIEEKILTKEQRDKIKKLQGKPFEFPQGNVRPGRPGIRPVPQPVRPIKPGKIQIKPIQGKKIQGRKIQIRINGKKGNAQILPIPAQPNK